MTTPVKLEIESLFEKTRDEIINSRHVELSSRPLKMEI